MFGISADCVCISGFWGISLRPLYTGALFLDFAGAKTPVPTLPRNCGYVTGDICRDNAELGADHEEDGYRTSITGLDLRLMKLLDGCTSE